MPRSQTRDHRSRRRVPLIATVLVAFFAGLAGGSITSAVAAESQWRLVTTNGEEYLTRGEIYSVFAGTKAAAFTDMQVATGSAPGGWMGAEARVYSAKGNVCRQGPMKYSDATSSNWWARIDAKCGAESYYGRGKTHTWTGSGYGSNMTYRSPNVTL